MESDLLERILSDLRRDEGLKLEPYQCTAGRWTIGYGRNFQDNPFTLDETLFLLRRERFDVTVAEYLLKNEVNESANDLRKIFDNFDGLPAQVRRVLINMRFNLGGAGFRKLTSLILAVRNKDWKLAANRMRQFTWRKQVGNRADRLITIMESVGGDDD